MKLAERLQLQEQILAYNISQGNLTAEQARHIILSDGDVLEEYYDKLFEKYRDIQHDMVDRLDELYKKRSVSCAQ